MRKGEPTAAKMLRGGFAVLIGSAPDLEVVGEAATGREAVELARSSRADVVLMDIRMPDIDGLTATRMITGDEDLAGVRVLILTTFEVDEYVYQALRAGASGFLGKSAGPAELLDAIRLIHRGEALLSPAATRSLIARFLASPEYGDRPAPTRLAALTEREREVVGWVTTGGSNEEIAAALYVSPATVRTHVGRAMLKLGARDRAQLVVFALHAGLQPDLLVQQHVFSPAPLADPFLQSGQVRLQFGDLILPSENRRRRLAGTVAIQVAAGINSVPAEEFTAQGDEIKRAIGLAPGCRGAGKVAHNEGLAQQPLHQGLHPGVGFDNRER